MKVLSWELVDAWHLEMILFPDHASPPDVPLSWVHLVFLDRLAPLPDSQNNREARRSLRAMGMTAVFYIMN